MHFPSSGAAAGNGELIFLESAGSTNDELLALASGAPEFTAVATTNQTAGRGRLGRQWIAPPGQSLAVSVLLRPRNSDGAPLDKTEWGWIPLLAGLAMARTVTSLLPSATAGSIRLKWPNDVLVGGRKISGLLAELLPQGDGLVLGAGLNLAIPAGELPTPTSTTLALEGAELRGRELVDAALSTWLLETRALYAGLLGGGDERSRGIRSQVVASCSTLGQQVRVQLPGGVDLVGTAVGLDDSGRLMIGTTTDGATQTVAAGDVTHLRYE